MINKLSRLIRSYWFALLVLCLFALGLSLYRIVSTGSYRYWFLAWNLLLATLPLLFAWALYKNTPKGLNWSWMNLGLCILWLVFLPNAFYLVTDFIHIHQTTEISMIFDVVLMATYSLAGFALGFNSLFLVHKRILQRFSYWAHWLIVAVLLLCGFAIYLGRYLRWNSWDIITNPFGLMFDVTTRISNPQDYTFTFSATLLFFALLLVVYFVVWRAIVCVEKKSSKRGAKK